MANDTQTSTKIMRQRYKTLYWEDKKLSEIKKEIDDLTQDFGTDACVGLETGAYDDYPYISLVYNSLETDQELKARVERTEKQIAYERQRWEELNKKYGDK